MKSILAAVGIVSILLSLAFSGLLGSGDRIRANYSKERLDDKLQRIRVSGMLLIIGVISLGIRYAFFE